MSSVCEIWKNVDSIQHSVMESGPYSRVLILIVFFNTNTIVILNILLNLTSYLTLLYGLIVHSTFLYHNSMDNKRLL